MRLLVGIAALAVLTGCQAAPVADDATHAVSSHLTNRSDMPITYDIEPGDGLTLLPGDDVVTSDGAWLVPYGYVCEWRTPTSSRTRLVVAEEFDTWTTFAGYDQIVESCSRLE